MRDLTQDSREKIDELIERLAGLNEAVNPNNPEVIRQQEERIRAHVVEKLAFTNMMDHEQRIPKAHQRTFEWIFQEPSDAGNSWSSFRSFLQDPSRKMYWITGKPGSGKSTLMKFISHNPQTSSLLETWGAGQHVVQAAFYFWNSGSHMQMSVDGLLQTLLHECLRQLPEFVQQTLPRRWKAATLSDKDDFAWGFDEVAPSLRRLMADICSDKKFFLIIDGLDECSGDQSRLIELLQELSDDITNVKLCLASRPLNNFEDAFRGKSSLMLQDLTRADMEVYITSRFRESEGFKELQVTDPDSAHDLLKGILRKSEGVFLWVHLVVRSLLEGLTNGDKLKQLHARLAKLPPDLEDLYERILSNLDQNYLDHASRLFQIVRKYRECHYEYWYETPTLLRVALADLDDQQVSKLPVKAQTEEELLALCKNMRRKLVSRCHGLLEVSALRGSDEIHHDSSMVCSSFGEGTDQVDDGPKMMQSRCSGTQQEVQYLHRSVRDYIEGPRIWDRLLSVNEKPFNPFLAFLRSSLLQLKFLPENIYPSSICRLAAPSVTTVNLPTGFLSQSKLGTQIWATIKFAKTALEKAQGEQEELEIVLLLKELDKTVTLITEAWKSFVHIQTDQGTLGIDHWATFFLLHVPKVTFLHMMAVCGMHQYVARCYQEHQVWEVQNDAPFILTVLEGRADRTGSKMFDAFEGPHIEVMRLVLRNGGNCHQNYERRSAWSVAKEREQQNVLELFREFAPEPPRSFASSDSPAASDPSGFETEIPDSGSGPSNAPQSSLDREPPRPVSQVCEIPRQTANQGPRVYMTSAVFDPPSREIVLPRSITAGLTVEWLTRAAFNSHDRDSPRDGRGLSLTMDPRQYDSMHGPAAHQTLFPAFRPRTEPSTTPPSLPLYYSYPYHHNAGPYEHYANYGTYVPDHRHYDAQYYIYHGSVRPPSSSDPRYHAPTRVSPCMTPPISSYPTRRSISYRSGWQSEQSLTRNSVPPEFSAGFR